VCIPAFQAEQHLRTTLNSVVAQSEPDLEILVLDNGSTDATAQILRAYSDPRIRVETNASALALPDNWNRLVELSRGHLVKIVCADDLIHPDCVRLQAAVLDSDPHVSLVASRRHMIDDQGQLLAANRGLRGLIGRHGGRSVAARVVRSGGNPIGEPGGALFRRRDFDTVGGFDGARIFPMDLDLWVKIIFLGDFVGMRQSLAAFRAGSGSLSSRASRAQYEEQRELTRTIAADPRWSISWHDRAIGHVGAPLSRVRRELLFASAQATRHGVLRPLKSSADARWLIDSEGTAPYPGV